MLLSSSVFFYRTRTGWKTGFSSGRRQLLNLAKDNADVKMEHIVYTNNRDGRDEWILHARVARYFKGDEKVYLENIQAELFSAGGKTITITGEKGTYDTKSRELSLRGSVNAVSSEQERFCAEAVAYDEGTQLLRTEEDVTIVTPRLRVEGTGLTYDLSTGKMAILSNVNVVTQEY